MTNPLSEIVPNFRIHQFSCKQGTVRAVRFNVDGNYCLTCGSDKTVKLWNPRKGVLLKTYAGHGYEVLDCQGSCDSSQIVSCGMDKSVMVWDVVSGQCLKRLRGHASWINTVVFNEESTVAMSGSVDCSVRCWDLRSKKTDPMQILAEGKDSIMSVKVSNHEIVTACVDGRIRYYDLRNGQLITDNVGESLTSVTLSRGGESTLVSCQDATVKLMDKESGEMLAEYTGHTSKDYKVESCLDYTDALVFSGSADGKVICWDLVEGKVQQRMEHNRAALSLATHPSKVELAVAAGDTVSLWGRETEQTDESIADT